MSWFGTDTIVQDSRPNEAVAEGVLLERRSVLRLSAATVASALAFAACASPKKQSASMGGLLAEPAPTGTLEIGPLLTDESPGSNGAMITQEIVESDCIDGWDSWCSPDCSNAVGRTYTTIDPLLLVGG
jgi:hypothetical protein